MWLLHTHSNHDLAGLSTTICSKPRSFEKTLASWVSIALPMRKAPRWVPALQVRYRSCLQDTVRFFSRNFCLPRYSHSRSLRGQLHSRFETQRAFERESKMRQASLDDITILELTKACNCCASSFYLVMQTCKLACLLRAVHFAKQIRCEQASLKLAMGIR